MRILHLGNGYFVDSFKQLGHDVTWAGSDLRADVRFSEDLISIDKVLGQLPFQWNPDLIVLGDQSTHPLILGLESLSVPLVWYAIDSHIHVNWHLYYGAVFDAIFVAQKDWVPAYRIDEDRQVVMWLPLFYPSSGGCCLGLDRDIPFSFVGTLNPRFNPDRVALIQRIQERFPIMVGSGSYLETFNRSMIVLNQSVANDINFRTFETMACGALLLTERIGNGFDELFEDRRHCVMYEKGNVEEILDAVAYYLDHRTQREMIAREGYERVMAAHTSLHRAQTMLDTLARCPLNQAVGNRLARQAPIEWSLASAYEQSAMAYERTAPPRNHEISWRKTAACYRALATEFRQRWGALAHV